MTNIIIILSILGQSQITEVATNTSSAIGIDYELDQPNIIETNNYGHTGLSQQEGSEVEIDELRKVNDGIASTDGLTSIRLDLNKLKDTCSVTLSYEPASCSTCCDATINATFNSNCPPYDLSWSPGDPTFPPSSACPDTTYVITMTDSCGCVATDSITPDSIPTGLKTAVKNNGDGFTVYPNPARSGVFIEPNKDHTIGIVSILDIYGRVVMNKAVHGKRWLDLSQLPQGVFIIKLMDRTNSRLLGSKKLIISRDRQVTVC